MLRARRVPPLLSRITGNGIHTVLLVTSDGELLGSTTTVQQSSAQSGEKSVSNNNSTVLPGGLDLASIGSLVAEVATDYKRAGNELSLLHGIKAVSAMNSLNSPPTVSTPTNRGTNPSSTSSSCGAATNKGSASPLKCLVVEFEQGIAGVASTGSNTGCFVVALAESNVEVGLIRARLVTLASYVGEALTPLAEPP